MSKQRVVSASNMSAKNLLMIVGLAIICHFLIQVTTVSTEASKKVQEAKKEAAVASTAATTALTTALIKSPAGKAGGNGTAPTRSDKKQSVAESKALIGKQDAPKKELAKVDSDVSKVKAAIPENGKPGAVASAAADNKSPADKSNTAAAKGPKDLSVAEGHHGKKKYVMVKKKPKHKKVKMHVYKPKTKYKKIKMKVPVKKMKKKKVKGYIVKKPKKKKKKHHHHHHHG